ncbi:SIR2 family protein [Methylomonas sp. UP202]|uniref:SIR2 family protein n=1 Tax=Methylomonas sp. UP202 TaxID=3040943 RepID=UPI0024798EB0|nr:SIR2 family protein [Methylomonas sp. UP202]WGS87727.1 SIR2 family protein [Methylomonas sp. UP202]
MQFRKDEVIFLLGAGASVDAGIPASCGMISKLEELLKDESWKKFAPLYNFVKSAIIYGDGIKGKFEYANFNIERLVNTLDELRKSDEHPLFPFIGSWNPKLPEVTENNFEKLGIFRKKIVEELSQQWVHSEYDEHSQYFEGLSRFQNEYQHLLRVFTLNYDLCVEKSCKHAGVERGFGEDKYWDWKIFENEAQLESNIFLYKLHGSIDWIRDDRGKLTYKDKGIPPEKIEIIFGTTYKLQYIDPFLFFAYEFRKRLMTEVQLLVCVGYGFADEHINGIITQALNGDHSRKMLVIMPTDNVAGSLQHIRSTLKLSCDDNVSIWNFTAKDFFNDKLTVEELAKIFPNEEAPFEEITN